MAAERFIPSLEGTLDTDESACNALGLFALERTEDGPREPTLLGADAVESMNFSCVAAEGGGRRIVGDTLFSVSFVFPDTEGRLLFSGFTECRSDTTGRR